MKLDAPTAQLIKIITQMAQQSQAALIAGTEGDEISTRHAVDALRTLRSKLAAINKDIHSHLERLPQHHQIEISQHLSQINSANFFIQSWCQRYQGIAKVEDLTRTVQGRHAILDYTLPLDWNFAGDVFILFDKEELAFVPKLNQRGQKRIVMVGPQLEIDPQVHANVNSVPDAVALREYFVGLDYPYPARLAFLNPQSQDLESQTWKDVLHAFTFAATNVHTIKALGMLWMTQGLANLKSVALSANIASLKSHLKGFPVVIVSPGPSLDKNIHLLKALKGRAILMAAAQCAGALESAGVVPDFIVVADPGNLVYMLDGVDASKIDGLIIGVASHPDFYKLPFENIITFNANGPIDTWISDIFDDNAPISSAPSVSIDCCMLAKYLECSCIIMVGLDLAIAAGKVYSKHSANSECNVICDEVSKTLTFANIPKQMENVFVGAGRNSENVVETLLTLPGYYGGTVQTRPNYYSFHREFVEFAKHERTQENAVPLINCTEGGAFIEGFRNVPLEQAIAEYLPKTAVNFSEKVDKACRSTNRKVRIEKYSKAKSRFVDNLERTLDLVATCKALAVKPKLNQKQRDKLNKTEKKLMHSVRKTPFLSLPNPEQVNRVTEMAVNTSTVTEINKVALQLYETVEVTGNQALRILIAEPMSPPLI